MFALHVVQPSPGMLIQQIVYLSASGLAGTGRFLVLRLFVSAVGQDKAAPRHIRRAPALKSIGGLRTSPRLAVS